MAERRAKRRRKEDDESEDEENEANDEQNEIAKYLRFNCETKSSTYQSEKMQYFKGAKAIDCLLDSKWASGKGGTEILFTDRKSVQKYLQNLLELDMFKRVTRVKRKKKSEKEESKKGSKDSPKSSKNKETSDKPEGSAGKKVKVKVKLELHEFQEFLDGEEVYMWVFDPVHPRTIIYGVLVVIGAVVICLFPLWPEQMREYTWYLSVGAAILLGVLIFVALFRYVLFSFVWLITLGKHHFWLLPNLTEDCGFFESFVPLYAHEYFGNNKGSEEGDKKEKSNDDNGGDKRSPLDEQNKIGEEEISNNTGAEQETEPMNDSTSTTSAVKEQTESESWINVTDEDIKMAKQATEHVETLTPSVNC
ncbi:translocation protein SEC62-like isoform X2 [Xenia sp. Carnegie-2017]|uniref:translocation protein SEC62-like isoform X2 n=1 Tax=Xenia sp. Carnegie-2017 TaxID=2897299 RepID=UPI001F0337BC|nr:translocation protein SEC62-like isoform X2 [Xenia sp. Carnegie-2017]